MPVSGSLSSSAACENCRVCGSKSLRRTDLRTCQDKESLGDFGVLSCTDCGAASTWPSLQPGEYALEVDSSALTDKDQTLGWVYRWFTRQRVRRITAFHGTPGRLLDFGAGACAFANAMHGAGWCVTALEPNAENRSFAASGVEFVEEVAEVGVGDFDVITLWHVLEHLPEPRQVLADLVGRIRPSGMLFVSVPDFGSLQARIGGQFWTYLDVPHHVVHLCHESMLALTGGLPLMAAKIYRGSLEYEPFGWVQTLLNLATRSHNHLYNRLKKRGSQQRMPFPLWTRIAEGGALPVFIAAGVGMAAAAVLAGQPCCIETAFRKKVP